MGDAALDLMKSLRQSREEILFAPFEDERLRTIFKECNALFEVATTSFKTIQEMGSQGSQPEVKSAIAELAVGTRVHTQTIFRNKRCVLSYLMRALEDLRWRTGRIPDDIVPQLSEEEKEYFDKYGNVLVSYFVSFKTPLNLIMDQEPPKSLLVNVRVVKDVGEIMLTSGRPVRLHKDSDLLLRTVDAEPLIREGILQRI